MKSGKQLIKKKKKDWQPQFNQVNKASVIRVDAILSCKANTFKVYADSLDKCN